MDAGVAHAMELVAEQKHSLKIAPAYAPRKGIQEVRCQQNMQRTGEMQKGQQTIERVRLL
jgi:hypothetical protein